MKRKQYRIDEFIGLNQSRQENLIHSSFSSDACNMSTENGNLSVAKGYVRHFNHPVPAPHAIYRMTTFTGSDGVLQYIVATDTALYASRSEEWTKIYDYKNRLVNPTFDFIQAKIGTTDYLIIGCGERQLVKYDGFTASLFGSEEKLSSEQVLYLDMYKGRLFSAGNTSYPNRLYWSKLPGDSRSIEDWRYDDASVNVEGGHTEIGSTNNDPIVALHAMSNQLLIFKKHGLYRLIGDRPSNFTIEKVDANFDTPAHTAIVPYGDSLIFMTKDGLCSFNGITVRQLADADCIKDILKHSFTHISKGAYFEGKFYFSICENKYSTANAIIEYDPLRSSYMIRRGFSIADICSNGNALFMINNTARYVYRFNEGDTYDGALIHAWWRTPRTDFLDKTAIKALRTIAFKGSSDTYSRVKIDVDIDGHTDIYSMQLDDSSILVKELPVKNEGRTISVKLYNENGGSFSIDGGIEIIFEKWRRSE